MLVLGCSNHQSVIIDEVITVTVINNRQGKVVLGIDAPDGVEIRRQDKSPVHLQSREAQVTDF